MDEADDSDSEVATGVIGNTTAALSAEGDTVMTDATVAATPHADTVTVMEAVPKSAGEVLVDPRSISVPLVEGPFSPENPLHGSPNHTSPVKNLDTQVVTPELRGETHGLVTPAVPLEPGSVRGKKRAWPMDQRKSLRFKLPGGATSVLSKATARLKGKDKGTSSGTGTTLVDTFPFLRLSIEEIEQLFQVYGIHLGSTHISSTEIITALQSMDRNKFEKFLASVRPCPKAIVVDPVVIDTDPRDFISSP